MGLSVGGNIKWGAGACWIQYQASPVIGFQAYGVTGIPAEVPYPYGYRNTQWTGISGSTPSQFIFSGWFNPSTFSGILNTDIISTQTSGRSSQFRFMFIPSSSTTATVQVRVFGASPFPNYFITFPNPINTGVWTHLAVSAYLPSVDGLRVVSTAVNGVAVTPSISKAAGFSTMGFTWDTNSLFTFADVQANTGYIYKGSWAEVYFAPGQYFDLASSGNIQKFISAGGGAVDLGTNGEVPTGTSPALYLKGPKSNFYPGSGSDLTNWGTGGAFTISGEESFSDSLTNPPSAP